GEAEEYVHFTRTAGGSTIAPEEHYDPATAAEREGDVWETAVEESELLAAMGQDHDQELYLAGATRPVIFASAIVHLRRSPLVHPLVLLAPPPRAWETVSGDPREPTDPFSAVVFKVQAGMDAAHRDRLAFMRVVSGEFERGMVT